LDESIPNLARALDAPIFHHGSSGTLQVQCTRSYSDESSSGFYLEA